MAERLNPNHDIISYKEYPDFFVVRDEEEIQYFKALSNRLLSRAASRFTWYPAIGIIMPNLLAIHAPEQGAVAGLILAAAQTAHDIWNLRNERKPDSIEREINTPLIKKNGPTSSQGR